MTPLIQIAAFILIACIALWLLDMGGKA